jgi:hypothetical protein
VKFYPDVYLPDTSVQDYDNALRTRLVEIFRDVSASIDSIRPRAMVNSYTTRTTALATTNYFTPQTDGDYRVTVSVTLTTAAGTSSTLGPITVSWTTPGGTGVVATLSDTTNTLGATLVLPVPMRAKGGTNINVAVGYGSVGSPMAYDLSVVVEQTT